MILLAVVLVLALGMIVFGALASRRGDRSGTPRIGGSKPPPGGGPRPPAGSGPET